MKLLSLSTLLILGLSLVSFESKADGLLEDTVGLTAFERAENQRVQNEESQLDGVETWVNSDATSLHSLESAITKADADMSILGNASMIMSGQSNNPFLGRAARENEQGLYENFYGNPGYDLGGNYFMPENQLQDSYDNYQEGSMYTNFMTEYENLENQYWKKQVAE